MCACCVCVCVCFCHVRFILDDSALYLSDKCGSETVDLRKGKIITMAPSHFLLPHFLVPGHLVQLYWSFLEESALF